ncbi:hypothetical protein [Streptomyces sp. NBC_01367]
MTQTRACRGPDAEGVWSDQHAAIGHRRPSVIDLEGGRQPVTAERDRRTQAVLTFSGEVLRWRLTWTFARQAPSARPARHGCRSRTRPSSPGGWHALADAVPRTRSRTVEVRVS